MKKLFILFLFLFCISKVDAAEYYITYSDWQEEYPYWLGEKFIEREDRYLWYREILNNETNEMEREETTEYFKELEGYIKIEESLKTFYRYITNERILLDGSRNIVYDLTYCYKNYCTSMKLPSKPEEVEPPEEIENPKTYDNIFVFIIVAFLSFVTIFLMIGSVNETKIKKAY